MTTKILPGLERLAEVPKMHLVSVRVRQAESFTKKGRVYVHHAASNSEPIAMKCGDPDCESWYCKSAHAAAFVMACGLEPVREDGYVVNPLSMVETDHKIHRRWMSAALKRERDDIEAWATTISTTEFEVLGLARSLGPIPRLRFSQKAGCSCGCSPGFIADGWRGLDVWLDFKSTDEVAQMVIDEEAERLAAEFDTEGLVAAYG